MRWQPESFIWAVPRAGYRWFENYDLDEKEYVTKQFLTDGRDHREKSDVVHYHPLEKYSGLFRTFADTEDTPEGVLAFANQYGWLGGSAKKVLSLEGDRLGSGELLPSWSWNILLMRKMLVLYDAVQADDREGLERRIQWRDHAVGYLDDRGPGEGIAKDPPYRFELIAADVGATRALFDTFARGDVVQPALHLITRAISTRLKEDVTTELVLDPMAGKRRLEPVAKGLLGALWLQFALAFQNDQVFRKCGECGTWFARAKNKEKLDRGYCSTTCRTNAYKGRIRQAVKLSTAGHSVEDIARQLEADPAAVAGWIAKATYEGDKST